MANNHEQATLNADVKLSDATRTILAATGAGFEENDDGTTYVYWEDGVSDVDFANLDTNPEDEIANQDVLSIQWDGKDVAHVLRALFDDNPAIQLLTVEAASWCDKMRQGEFGGWVAHVTRTQFCYVNTNGAVGFDTTTGQLVPHVQIEDWGPHATEGVTRP